MNLKQPVYFLSNTSCNPAVNASFTLANMGKNLLAQLLEATEEKGMKPGEVAKGLGVSFATYTNWKKRGNVPPARLKLIASFLKKSADELLTGAPADRAAANVHRFWGFDLGYDGAELGAEWQKIENATLKGHIRSVIFAVVTGEKNDGRKKRKAVAAKSRPREELRT